jgi:alpha-beta hydrolase superfamily lysophospholipase
MADPKWQFRNVEFQSEGATLRGRLYTPKRFSPPLPAVVMAHGFSATITMTIDHYAETICSEGFAVLLYDHRNLGSSDGEPRHHINPWVQARGYLAALSYVEGLEEVDSSRLALWGDSASAVQVIVVSSIDERVKAVVAQVPALGPVAPPQDPDGARFERIKETLLHGDVSGTPETMEGPMPVVSFDYKRHPAAFEPLTAYRWFIEYGGRIGTNWVNDVTRVRPNTPEPWNGVICAPYVKAPLLMMVSPHDEMRGANPKVARLAFESAPEPKEWMEIEGGHFGLLYYPSELFDRASSAQCGFLKVYLSGGNKRHRGRSYRGLTQRSSRRRKLRG